MTAELLAHYERIADAPDAIARLRSFILGLAVRGKLVPQDPTDEAPDKNLALARRELETLAANTGRLRWQPSQSIGLGEVELPLPARWLPARLNDTGLYINGLAFKESDWKGSGTPIIRIQNLTDPKKEFNFTDGQFPDELVVRDGDLLVSWSATLEAFMWSRGTGVLNQHIFRVIPAATLTTKRFLYLLLRHAIQQLKEGVSAHGLVMTHINRGPFLAHVVAIPPISEQLRIVESFDELMALCSLLEVARTQRERRRDQLAAASLARLNTPDPVAFQDDARFALHALPALTTRPDQIKQLRQAILNLAVRGKLVPQDPTDEPASDLLKRIAANKLRLVQTGELTRDKSLPPVPKDGLPFELPPGWVWERLGNIGETNIGLTYSPQNISEVGIPVLRSSNIQNGKLDFADLVRVSVEPKQSVMVQQGDLLICARNGSRALVGKVALIGELKEPAAFGAFMAIFRSEVNQYLYHFICAPLFRQVIAEVNTTTINQITQSNLRATLAPLPPLAEQARIVAKVDELMLLCERLEVSIVTGHHTRRRLLDALLHEALEHPARELEATA